LAYAGKAKSVQFVETQQSNKFTESFSRVFVKILRLINTNS